MPDSSVGGANENHEKSEARQNPAQANADAPTNGVVEVRDGREVAADPQRKKQRPAWVRVLFIIGMLVVLFLVIPWGIGRWRYSQTHVSTDDAYVTGNLVSVSPIISGTLQQLTVDEGYKVRRDQLLARIDPSGPQATLRQAAANYAAAESQIPQAERNLKYQQELTAAAIQKAQSALESQRARTMGAARQVSVASGTSQNQIKQAQAEVLEARAQADQAASQAQSTQASLDNYRQAVETARASLDNYQQQVQTAVKAEAAAQAHIVSAQSDLTRAAKDEERYRILYTQDAVSAQVYDSAKNQRKDAEANAAAAEAQDDQAKSQIAQAQASARQAQSQVLQAQKSVAQAEAVLRAANQAADAARRQVDVSLASLGLAHVNKGQIGIQQANFSSTSSQSGGSEADLSTAQAGKQEVDVKRRQIETYVAQAAQAKAALDNAKISLHDTYIYAPNDGTVVKKTANIGASLSPGQSILIITQADYVWVEANFKETQLTDVKPGESAEVEVDAMPGKVFKGRVHSINEATGAATSLLPPDNATGNFTKVVQRIPVRIELRAADSSDDAKYARAKDLEGLRQGMSVTATIDTSNADAVQDDKGPEPNASSGSQSTSQTPGGAISTGGASSVDSNSAGSATLGGATPGSAMSGSDGGGAPSGSASVGSGAGSGNQASPLNENGVGSPNVATPGGSNGPAGSSNGTPNFRSPGSVGGAGSPSSGISSPAAPSFGAGSAVSGAGRSGTANGSGVSSGAAGAARSGPASGGSSTGGGGAAGGGGAQ